MQIGSTNYQSQVLNSSESLSTATLTNNFVATSANYSNNATSSVTPRPLQNVHTHLTKIKIKLIHKLILHHYSPSPNSQVIPSCVYLMSKIAVHMEIEGTAQCPAQVMLAAALGCEELGIANKLLAQSVFGLWMSSPLLEIQLKPHNRPYAVRISWSKLLEKYSHGNAIQKKYDEPMVGLKRSVYFSKKDEEKIK